MREKAFQKNFLPRSLFGTSLKQLFYIILFYKFLGIQPLLERRGWRGCGAGPRLLLPSLAFSCVPVRDRRIFQNGLDRIDRIVYNAI